MSLWVPAVLLAGVAIGWLLAYRHGTADGYHQGFMDGADQHSYLAQFDRDVRRRTTSEVARRITHDIKEHR